MNTLRNFQFKLDQAILSAGNVLMITCKNIRLNCSCLYIYKHATGYKCKWLLTCLYFFHCIAL